MTANPQESSEGLLLPHLIGLVAGLAAVAILIGLFTYSVIDVVGDSGKPAATADAAPARTALTVMPTYAPGAFGPAIAPGFRQVFIFLLCEGETAAAIYPNSIYHFYFSLRPATDRDAILDLLAGRETQFPPDALLYQSPCVRAGVDKGTYP